MTAIMVHLSDPQMKDFLGMGRVWKDKGRIPKLTNYAISKRAILDAIENHKNKSVNA